MVKTFACPICSKPYPVGKSMGEEFWIKHPTGEVAGLSRKFLIICSEHGRFVGSENGNHSSISEKRLKKLFPKKIANRLKELLSPEEGKKFSRSLHGFHHPTSDDEARWRKLSLQIIAQKV